MLKRPDVDQLRALIKAGRYSQAADLVRTMTVWNAGGDTRQLVRIHDSICRLGSVGESQLGPLLDRFLEELEKSTGHGRSAFIVHGWDSELKLATKNYLQNSLGLECLILHEQAGDGGTIIDKFERFAGRVDVAFVLLSEWDDTTVGALSSPDAPKRPRPNVLFELGYFFGKLGRRNVVILKKGNVDIHSDILGIEFIDVTTGVESGGEAIRKRISWLLS